MRVKAAKYLILLILISCGANQEDGMKLDVAETISPMLPLPEEVRINLGLPEQQRPIDERHLKLIMEASDEFKIKTGTYAGECVEYCKYQHEITSAGIKTTKEAWNLREDLPELPPIISLRPVNSVEYVKLMDILTAMNLESGTFTYGCPDCVDQGGEWFEIAGNDLLLKINCEPGQFVENYAVALDAIRKIRMKN